MTEVRRRTAANPRSAQNVELHPLDNRRNPRPKPTYIALTPVDTAAEAGLTDAQRETLMLGHERGYLESPQEVTLEEFGEKLGITRRAVGSHLRNGDRHVIGTTRFSLTVRSRPSTQERVVDEKRSVIAVKRLR